MKRIRKTTISLCMIALNDEERIARALKNIQDYVDEIIVVDGGSQDKTIEIAKQFGAKVIEKKWNDNFAAQRNYSLKQAAKDWILVMDTDEVFEKKLLDSLQRFSKNNVNIDAYAFPRKNYIDGKRTNAYPDRQIRFFLNNKKIKYKNRIHEIVQGFKLIASPTDMHILHRKTSIRQRRQDSFYRKLDKKYRLKYYRD